MLEHISESLSKLSAKYGLDKIEFEPNSDWLWFNYKGYECGWGIGTDLYQCFDLDREYRSLDDLVEDIASV